MVSPILAQATRAIGRGDAAGAERILLDLLQRHENPDALLLLAGLKQDLPDQALALLQRALAARPGHAQSLLQLGKILVRLGRDTEAARAFQDALLWEPRSDEARYGLGDAQQRLGDLAAAEKSFRQLLEDHPGHLLGRLALGLTLKQAGQPARAAAEFSQGLSRAGDALMQAAFAYNLALVQRDQGDQESALANFTLVSTLDPARAAGDMARAAILEESNRPLEAASLLEQLIAREPLNPAAHAAYNNFLYRQERDDDFLKSYDRAPAAAPLQLGKAGFLLKTGRLEEALALFSGRAEREPGNLDAVMGTAAVLCRLARPAEAFALLNRALERHAGNLTLHHQLAVAALQLGEARKAAAIAQKAVELAPLDQYGLALQGLAWRLLGDERHEILNGYNELIAVFDLEAPSGFSSMAEFNAELDAWLQGRHRGNRAPLDQTLRGGTQTTGHLFNEAGELLHRLRSRITAAMEQYTGTLRADTRHPFRSRRAAGFRFTGSWSSRLSDCGFHVNHVHPEGWISSCYYVGVPAATREQTAKQGWIKFGEPSFDTGLGALRFVQPLPGRLVLFPSYMWHGTIPFHDPSPRTTIAFDAIPAPR